jgi:hypothetical protein
VKELPQGGRIKTHRITMSWLYFISSNARGAKTMGSLIRAHWSIENRCHRVLDVAFREDESRIPAGQENIGLLRKIALDLLKQDQTTKRGIAAKRKKSGWNHDYFCASYPGPFLQIRRARPGGSKPQGTGTESKSEGCGAWPAVQNKTRASRAPRSIPSPSAPSITSKLQADAAPMPTPAGQRRASPDGPIDPSRHSRAGARAEPECVVDRDDVVGHVARHGSWIKACHARRRDARSILPCLRVLPLLRRRISGARPLS